MPHGIFGAAFSFFTLYLSYRREYSQYASAARSIAPHTETE